MDDNNKPQTENSPESHTKSPDNTEKNDKPQIKECPDCDTEALYIGDNCYHCPNCGRFF